MIKRIVALMSILLIIFSFTSCSGNKNDTFTAEDGNQYIVVRDSEGNIVINDSQKLQVYPLNENGKKQKSDSGEYITEYIDFNGQVVIENMVETAELRFRIPNNFSDNAEIPGYFYSKMYDSEIYFTYYDEDVDSYIESDEKNCESLLESFGSEVFSYEKYAVTIGSTECIVFKNACTSSEYYKNAYNYYIPYDTGFYVVNCIINTDNAKKVNFDKFAEAIIIK